MTQKYLNELTYTIIGAAIEVHKELGPGLLESIYEKCLAHLLKEKGLQIITQQKVPLLFRGLYLDCDLKLLNKPKGILLNFNCINIFKEGQKTMVTELYSGLPKGY